MLTYTFLCLICGSMMFFILVAPQLAINAVTAGMHLWWSSVFPSIFPFFVFTSILKQTGLIEQLIYKSSRKADYNLIFITLIGWICGYPSTSKLIGQNDTINFPLPIYALSTSPSPVFITGTVAALFLQNTRLALYILAATYLSLITTYMIIKFAHKDTIVSKTVPPKIHQQPLGNLITSSIFDGLKAQGVILGIILMVSILGVFMETTGIFEFMSLILYYPLTMLGIPSLAITPFLKGLLEMTTGINAVCSESISLYNKITLCGFISSFGGMSIFLESISFINNKIRAIHIFVVKLLHGFFTYIYAKLLLFLFPFYQNVSANLPTYTYPSFPFLLSTSCIVCVFMLLILHQIARQDS